MKIVVYAVSDSNKPGSLEVSEIPSAEIHEIGGKLYADLWGERFLWDHDTLGNALTIRLPDHDLMAWKIPEKFKGLEITTISRRMDQLKVTSCVLFGVRDEETHELMKYKRDLGCYF